MPVTMQQMTGSWFPSGYYGHFRGKPRANLSSEFRQLARPNPPTKFLNRQNSEATSHAFSQHDNRLNFESDPLVRCTQAGFGKRKCQTGNRGEFDPFFIGWFPANVDRKRFIEDIKTSSYADDYNGSSTSSQIHSDIQSMTLSPSSEVSLYSSVYSHGQPDPEQAKQIRQETFERYSTTQKRRIQLQRSERSFNVASCLVWNSTENESKKMKDKPKNFLSPIPIKSRNSFNGTSRTHQPKLSHSQSIQLLKTKDQPTFDGTTSNERYSFTTAPLPQVGSSFEQTNTSNMDCLISKYM